MFAFYARYGVYHVKYPYTENAVHRGYLLFCSEYHKYLHRMWWKHWYFHECEARVKMQMFSKHEMKYFWYLPKKSKFSFYFIRRWFWRHKWLRQTWCKHDDVGALYIPVEASEHKTKNLCKSNRYWYQIVPFALTKKMDTHTV